MRYSLPPERATEGPMSMLSPSQDWLAWASSLTNSQGPMGASATAMPIFLRRKMSVEKAKTIQYLPTALNTVGVRDCLPTEIAGLDSLMKFTPSLLFAIPILAFLQVASEEQYNRNRNRCLSSLGTYIQTWL